MSTLTILFMLRWATLWVNKSNPESTRIRNNQSKRLDYCHIRTTAVVTLVPLRLSHLYHDYCHTCTKAMVLSWQQLWYCRDNRHRDSATCSVPVNCFYMSPFYFNAVMSMRNICLCIGCFLSMNMVMYTNSHAGKPIPAQTIPMPLKIP